MYYTLYPYPEKHTHAAAALLPLGEFEKSMHGVHTLVFCAVLTE
jgi:hypothetical protein